MTTNETKTYRVGVVEAILTYYLVEAGNPTDAAENWVRGDIHDHSYDVLDTNIPHCVEELQPDGTFIELTDVPFTRPFSVLLLYPDHCNDTGTETYYTFVTATDPLAAVDDARHQLVVDTGIDAAEAESFHPLLVVEGHRMSEPLFNK